MKKIFALLLALCLVLAGLLVWSRIDRSHYKLYRNIISQEKVRDVLFGQPISPERNGEYRLEDLKWLYTALTRASEQVYLVNFKDESFA